MPMIKGKYYTDQEIANIKEKLNEAEFERFLVSGIVGAVTGSSIMGALVGGDLTGGLIGDLLSGTDDSIF